MSRRDRRAALARGKAPATASLSELAADATLAVQQGRSLDAEVLCKQILAVDPRQPTALNIMGLLYQASGNHRLAAKSLAKAVAANAMDAACHYNLAASYQALGQRGDAARHYRTAIALGLSGRGPEPFLLQDPTILQCLSRIEDRSALPVRNEAIFGTAELAAIAENTFLRCALGATIIRGVPLETFLTALRQALLRRAERPAGADAGLPDDERGLFCALAEQCFLNEYVFAQTAEETGRAERLRALLQQKLADGSEMTTGLLAAVAAYYPLHALHQAEKLLGRRWPEHAAGLIRQQIKEPLEEIADRAAIPALTAIDRGTSVEVMRQYEENPYPRWTINPLSLLGRPKANSAVPRSGPSILIAGCGTGEHPFDIAQKSPDATILAIDLSRMSLAYARRKTREEGLRNIEYAQADILNLATIGRTFDRIEAVGVLHHLADPQAGWRVLLSLLAPNGVMRVGLYSEIARRSIVAARAIVAERGYPPTAEGIRALRQSIIREKDEPRWASLVQTVDFYSTSGCRDMFFNVMEHRLTIAEIKSFLDQEGFAFLGFELDAKIIGQFRQRNPAADALTDLDAWAAFEADNPETFLNMYVFSIGRRDASAPDTR
jgi:2-polyprenyl-3-methyl-5-hydroxy-6-metoxy-1,4-benzoquinol methylase/tetratricopeptide (TPR) repeat protein